MSSRTPTVEPRTRIPIINSRMEELASELDVLNNTAAAEKRDLSRAEALRFDRGMDEMEELRAEKSRLEEQELRDRPRRKIGEGRSEVGKSTVVLDREQRMADWSSGSGDQRFDEEAEDFSLGRLLRGMVTGQWANGDLERRALSEGTNSAGGFLTPEPLANRVIDRIRNQAKVFDAGALTVPMESDTLSIPRLATGVTPAWRNENAAVAESDPTFERVTFTARTLAVMTRLSYELFMDMTPAGAEIIQNELIQALAVELDRVALRGSGTPPEPRGIKNQSGITTITNGANGTAMAYSMLVNAVAAVQALGFNPNASILAPRATKSLALLADTTNQPLRPPPYLDGHRLLVTNQVPINVTTGTNSDTSEIYTAQWDQLLVGFRPIVEISVSRVSGPSGMVGLKTSDTRYMDTMQVAILTFLRADIQLQHPEAFAVSTGVRP